MTDDRFIRRLPGLMHELAGDDEGHIDEVLVLTARMRQRPAWTLRERWLPSMDIQGRRPLLSWRVLAVLALLALVATLVVAGTAVFVGSQPQATLPSPSVPSPSVPSPSVLSLHASNGWIAVSTLPGDKQEGGSDIYLVRQGAEPRLIAQRDSGGSRNVCPAFSPDGTKLAYGTGGNAGWAVVVLGVDANGTITGPAVRLSLPAPAPAPCPRWSSDGTRVAYLDNGVVVVRGLDGSSPAGAAGDPGVEDFDVGQRRTQQLVSPAGDRIARRVGSGIVVARRDGSDAQLVQPDSPCYAFGAWSPDGRIILCLQDVSGHDFAILAITVDRPYETVTITPRIPVHDSRSWPGVGDVSWQPIYP